MIRTLTTKQQFIFTLHKNKNAFLIRKNLRHFSSQPDKQEKPENQNKKRFRIAEKLSNGVQQKNEGSLFLSRWLRRKNEQNMSKMAKLQHLNRILTNNLKNIDTGFVGKNPLQQYLNYVMLGLLIFSVLYKLSKNKQKSADSQAKSHQKLAESEISSQKFESEFLKIRKIYIESRQYFDSNSDEENQNLKNVPKKKMIRYQITMIDKDGKKYTIDPYVGDPNKLLSYIENLQRKHQVTEKIDVLFQSKEAFTYYDALIGVIGYLTPFIPIIITFYLFRVADPSSIMKNFSKEVKQLKIQAIKDIKTRFKDVAGMQQAKKQITEFVDFMKYNDKYKQMGAKIPKGALLTGPPGTGKTMLARACAGEAGVTFFYISGSQFVEVFVGVGAAKVRQLFAKARENAPSIIFIDQIDAIGRQRQKSGNQQKDTTLNQLLVEMDGFSSNQTIIVLAATNRKEILDNALTRPGRFDRMVEINLPDLKAREEIFMVHLSPLKINPQVQMKTIAKRLSQLTPGFSGADIANLCNEAAIIATRKDRQFIIDKDFEEATERITAGYVKNKLLKQKTKRRVAYHEAGHAVSSWFLKGGDPLVKLTIIPRSKGSLGYAQYLPKTKYIIARNELIDKVAIMLSGITSQQVFLGEMSSGGSDDLQKVYRLTRSMVTQYGMGIDTYNMTLDENSFVRKQSTYLADKMQEEVSAILQQAKKRSRQIIEEKKQVIEALAKQLLEKETLNNDQILKIMGQRPNFQEVKKAEVLV